MNTRRVTVLMATVALAATGCEALIPLAISEASKGDPPPSGATAPLSVEIESASGSVDGRSMSVETLSASGARTDAGLHFELLDEELLLLLDVNRAETSGDNPYTGAPGDPGVPPGEGRPIAVDAGFGEVDPSLPGVPGASLVVCNAGRCQTFEDFSVEIVETGQGRRALVEGQLPGGDRVDVTLRYTEAG